MNLLKMRGITKEFPGVKALDNVSFEVAPSEIHALCGENGAGKSTLMKILSGLYPFDSFQGQIEFNGNAARFADVRDSQRTGIAIVYQELSLLGELTVAENVFLGREPTRFGLIDWDSVYAETAKLLSGMGFSRINPYQTVRDLSIGDQQLVEITKALSQNAKLLIFDEPTSALAEEEVEVFLNLLRHLKSKGISTVLITHKLNEVFAVADRITVFRDGKSIACHQKNDVNEQRLIAEMVGREVKELFPKRNVKIGRTILDVRNLCVDDEATGKRVLSNISFSLKEGEVLGWSGLMGCGRSELLMHLFAGRGKRISGSVLIDGVEVKSKSPEETIELGLAMVTEDRKRLGLILEQSVLENTSLASLKRIARWGVIDGNAERKSAVDYVKDFRIKTPSTETAVNTLSGGNQQKVVLAKWMLTKPRILFLDEPTRGIDVGARYEIYTIVNELASKGVAVMMVSSELPEVLGMSDRVMVLCEGKVTGEFDAKHATQEKIMERATSFEP